MFTRIEPAPQPGWWTYPSPAGADSYLSVNPPSQFFTPTSRWPSTWQTITLHFLTVNIKGTYYFYLAFYMQCILRFIHIIFYTIALFLFTAEMYSSIQINHSSLICSPTYLFSHFQFWLWLLMFKSLEDTLSFLLGKRKLSGQSKWHMFKFQRNH